MSMCPMAFPDCFLKNELCEDLTAKELPPSHLGGSARSHDGRSAKHTSLGKHQKKLAHRSYNPHRPVYFPAHLAVPVRLSFCVEGTCFLSQNLDKRRWPNRAIQPLVTSEIQPFAEAKINQVEVMPPSHPSSDMTNPHGQAN